MRNKIITLTHVLSANLNRVKDETSDVILL
jgi:hypothetical protein